MTDWSKAGEVDWAVSQVMVKTERRASASLFRVILSRQPEVLVRLYPGYQRLRFLAEGLIALYSVDVDAHREDLV